MAESSSTPFQPLVVGAPRSGFTLLCSVVIHFVPLRPPKANLRQQVLNALMRSLGDHVSSSIVAEFARRDVTTDLIYNANFRLLQGGPKWLRRDRLELAAFRKYIGVRGKGDFTLVTSHPREVLDADAVLHSHVEPGLWPTLAAYDGYTRYASVRNPVGILNSSVHSLNALASEYIQRFVPPEDDNDLLRQRLALYKLTDLRFMDGLVRWLVGYLEDFVRHMDRYTVMRWEDLILDPVPTIVRLAAAAGIDIDDHFARDLWSKLDHVNLTGHHRHNYRAGKGIVGDWKHSITNEHLELFRSRGLGPLCEALGYGPMADLDEREYTPLQKRISDCISRGEVCHEVEDQDLFTFAWNKSNIVSDQFPFRRHDWREWTQIERSIFTDEPLERVIWDVAEDAVGRLNRFFFDLLKGDYRTTSSARRYLHDLRARHLDELGRFEGSRYEQGFAEALALVDTARAPGDIDAREPATAGSQR